MKAGYLRRQFGRPEQDRPWALELSGRSLDLGDEIRATAEAAAQKAGGAAKSMRFEDICWRQVHEIRSHGNLDVFIEPISGDDAHANLVIIDEPPSIEPLADGAAPKPSHEIYRDIATLLRITSEADLPSFEALRQQPPAS